MKDKKHAAFPLMNDYSSRKEWEAACWQKIVKSERLLQLLLTPHERHDIILRAAAIEALVRGKSYRRIGEELWLSPQTVSALKKALRENEYKSYFERSKKERKKKEYSADVNPTKRPKGRPKRTKYGTIYLPY